MKSILLKNKRLLVHGFTADRTKGSLEERIKHVIANNYTHEICTCTIELEDHSKNNCFQPVGLIIGDCSEVTYCRNIDGGTMRQNNGVLIGETEGGYINPNTSEIEKCILNRPKNLYNEFRIKNYTVIGFYISKDEGELGVVSNIITNELVFYNQTSHYKLPYYFTVGGELNEVKFNDETGKFTFFRKVAISQLYS
jgi:hypothetical protein